MTQKTLIIAEAGVNHDGDLATALALVDAAAAAGADVVKFQTFRADKLASRHAAKAEYQKRETGADETQAAMLRRLELDEAAHEKLIARCAARAIAFLSSPFDPGSLDLLAWRFDLPRIKLGSGEITNAPLLVAVGRTGKPVILSTGMSHLAEIEQALAALAIGYLGKEPGGKAFAEVLAGDAAWEILRAKVALLHCTTQYPTPVEDVNLKAMDTLRAAFGLPVGYSDHTNGIAVALAAVARGASIIEKHFTLDRTRPGPDHAASLEPGELKAMVEGIRAIEAALGDGIKRPAPSESANIEVARKSLVAARPIPAGTLLTAGDITVKRPGGGLSPFAYWDLIGRRAPKSFVEDEPLI